MVSFTGPDVQQTVFKPVVEISDSKKFDDGVLLKINGSNGSSEFDLDDVVNIYVYIKDYLQAKGMDPDLAASANRILDQGYLSESTH